MPADDTLITPLPAAPASRAAPAACHHGVRCFAIATATFLFIAVELGVLALEARVLGIWH